MSRQSHSHSSYGYKPHFFENLDAGVQIFFWCAPSSSQTKIVKPDGKTTFL